MLGDPAVVDDRVLAVLGHELGHVAPRHVLRRLLQTAAVYLAATVPWGDTARPAASGPVLLNALGYPRDLEREADDFALAFLRANGMTPAPLTGLFQGLEQQRGKVRSSGFLSTHPAPGERWRRLPAQ